jgi:hypothetical protein
MLAVIAGPCVISAALGVRQAFGLFIGLFSYDHRLPVTLIALAIVRRCGRARISERLCVGSD